MTNQYQKAGVDIDAGNAFVDFIKPFAAKTKRPGCMGAIGGFGAFFDPRAAGYKDPVLVATTDGVGSKLALAKKYNRLDVIGYDLVAMCVNDLIACGAEPLFFLDYLATGRLNLTDAKTLVAGIVGGCNDAKCALIGGETAEMPNLYGNKYLDLAGFAVGAVEREKMDEGLCWPSNNDVVLGLASSGLHANGYSLIRTMSNSDIESRIDELLTPTRIYVRSYLETLKHKGSRAVAHITGGGLIDNIARVIPNNVRAVIDGSTWQMPDIYNWISERRHVAPLEMARVFNCGIGMVVIVPAYCADSVRNDLKMCGETVHQIGHIEARPSNSNDGVILINWE